MQSEPTTQRNLYYPSYPFSFFLTHTAPPDISTLSLHDALPISPPGERRGVSPPVASPAGSRRAARPHCTMKTETDRKSTRLNSSHVEISYAVFCLKKKKKKTKYNNYFQTSHTYTVTSSSHQPPY